MNIGNKIKELRKQRGITQEQLADRIGISFQAVSKWENNIAFPDITLAPVLASFFGVSLDELFDFKLSEVDSFVEKIATEARNNLESNPAESKRIIEKGLKKYPENDVLLNILLYTTNYSQEPDETIDIATRIIDKTNRNEIKYDALRFLAYAYKAKSDLVSAEAAIEQIPEIYFTKLTEMAFILSGPKKFTAAEKQKKISLENLFQMMAKIAECYEENNEIEKAIQEMESAITLIQIFQDDYYKMYSDYFNRKIESLKSR